MYLRECIKMVVTSPVINIFSRNLHHWIQHTQSYQSMLQTQFLGKIPNGPFSHSGSHMQCIRISVEKKTKIWEASVMIPCYCHDGLARKQLTPPILVVN